MQCCGLCSQNAVQFHSTGCPKKLPLIWWLFHSQFLDLILEDSWPWSLVPNWARFGLTNKGRFFGTPCTGCVISDSKIKVSTQIVFDGLLPVVLKVALKLCCKYFALSQFYTIKVWFRREEERENLDLSCPNPMVTGWLILQPPQLL